MYLNKLNHKLLLEQTAHRMPPGIAWYLGKTSDKNPVHIGDVVCCMTLNREVFGSSPKLRSWFQDRIDMYVVPSWRWPHIKYPLQRLYPLELPSLSSTENIQKSIPEPETEIQADEERDRTVAQTGRPTRAAARIARENVKAITFQEQDSDQDWWTQNSWQCNYVEL